MRLDRVEDQLYRLIGERVRRRRRELDWSQDALAENVKLARTSVTNLEKGRQKLSLHHLLLIAEAMDIELRELIPTRAELKAGPPVGVPFTFKKTQATVSQRTYEELRKLVEGAPDDAVTKS